MAWNSSSRKEIIEVATQLFSSPRGFYGTSIRDIAKKVGVAPSSIYHFFNSKEELFLGIFEQTMNNMAQRLLPLLDQEMDPVERLKLMLKTSVSIPSKERKNLRIILSVANVDDDAFTEKGIKAIKRIQRDFLEIYLESLKRVQAKGLLRGRNLYVLAFQISGVINWQLRWYKAEGPTSQEQLCKETVSFVLNGIMDADYLEL